MKKIKVIEVSSDTNIGGAGKCLLTLLREFDYDTFDVKVILPPKSLLKPYIDNMEIEVIEVDGIAEKSLDVGSIKRLREVFKREKPDVVHTHASMSARIAAKQAGTKVVYTRHSVFPPSPKISKGIGKVINGMINNHYADGIIAVAEAAKENLTDTGINPDKIQVILNGVDELERAEYEEREEIKKRFGVKNGETVLSIVARLEDIKGHKYFIEAADMLIKQGKSVKCFIAGTGSYEEELKALVKKLGRENEIIFTGFIKDADKLMNITDIQVNASYGTEATSLALLEGMSIGVPAVVSDFGGNPGVIKNGVNGYVVPKQNSRALFERLSSLIDDKADYEKLSKGAKEMFKSTFTAEAMTRATENMYKKVLGGYRK